MHQILNHAKVHSHLEINPASSIRRNPGRKFNRFLSRDEINRLHEELDRCVAERHHGRCRRKSFACCSTLDAAVER